MHIPDGYLSPSTCATLYLASAPFWYTALRRMRRMLATRVVPLLSVFSAFSFVIMMFNLPLPGGTTGHAVGMAISSIVLGPWFSLLAISTALLIQALLFGDGGITAFGANCFNMAIIGSFAAYAVYRLLARGAALTAKRRILAAGIAGYCAINLAALAAAVEFGVQPLWFHTASGVPLYAPYPLRIAIPAMLLGHLTFAGIAEFVISAGLVAYLQHADPSLLRRSAPNASEGLMSPRAWQVSRKLWPVLGLFLVLTPLGILAAGGAWGEWRAADFRNPNRRAAIVAASGGHALPEQVPAGLTRLSNLWTAPLPDYSPAFIRSAPFGYLVSAAVGSGAIILLAWSFGWLSTKIRPSSRLPRGFLEKTIGSLLHASEEAIFAEAVAQQPRLLQRLDPRVKLASTGALLLAVIAVHRLSFSAGLFLLTVLLVFFARIPLGTVVSRVWLGVLVFTGPIALPAIFLTTGLPITRLPLLDWPVTQQGLLSAAFLLLRAETAATLVTILILTTRWNRLLRALRVLHVPAAAVVILQMSYRYIFVTLQSAYDLFESRRARLLAPLAPAEQRASASAIAGVLLDRSLLLSNEVHLAMQARGFRGEVHLLDDLVMSPAGWLQLAAVVTLSILTIWLGR